MRGFRPGVVGAIFVVACGCTAAVGDEEGTETFFAGETTGRARVLTIHYEVQQTGYWCGPTATRMALSARMDPPSQQQLANQLGTTTNGTNWIGQVTQVLNANLGKKVYETREMPNDPPTAAQRNRFWDDIVRSIDANYPLVANIVAPPSNHPPGYPNNQTIYHYVAIIGYEPDARKVYVADSANFGGNKLYWLTFDQMATLVPPKGYSTAVVVDVVGCGTGKTVGAIDTKYRELGGCSSILGAPVSDEKGTPDGIGRYSVFEKGSIYWTAKLGAHEVHGRIRDAWKTYGWEAGALGYPISDERAVAGGRRSDFEHGSITWTSATDKTEVSITP